MRTRNRSNSAGSEPAVAYRLRHGLTLVELVVSMAIMSVLAVGISSAMVVATRSIERPDSPSACIREASSVSHQVMTELTSAVAVPERESNAVTIAVPDRDRDGVSEQIRYAWDGTPGGILTRQYNAETACPMLSTVYAFTHGYDLLDHTLPDSGRQDVSLADHNSPTDLSSFRPGSMAWISQCFKPALAADVVSWRVTRVVVQCRKIGIIGAQLTIQLKQAQAGGTPGATTYAETTVSQDDLSGMFSWQSFGLQNCPNIAADQSVCLLLKGDLTSVCEVCYHNRNVYRSGWFLSTSVSGGVFWTTKSSQALQFEIYGTTTGTSEQAAAPEQVLGAVRWELQVGSDSGNLVNGGAQLANLPE